MFLRHIPNSFLQCHFVNGHQLGRTTAFLQQPFCCFSHFSHQSGNSDSAEKMTTRSKIERHRMAHPKELEAPAVPTTEEKTHLFEKKDKTYIPRIRHYPIKTEQKKAARLLRKFDIEDYPDPFVGIPEVFATPSAMYEKLKPGLPNLLLFSYLTSKDAVMIFFYDHTDPVSKQLRGTVKEAARTTQRPNHAYLAIDCKNTPNICARQGISSVPYFKLYSRGRVVGGFNDETSAADLRKFVETSPVLEAPRMIQIQCKTRDKVTRISGDSGMSGSQSTEPE